MDNVLTLVNIRVFLVTSSWALWSVQLSFIFLNL